MTKDEKGLLLFKFGKNEHIKELYENGKIYFNTINNFKKLKNDDNLRSDSNENITNIFQSDKCKIKVDNDIVQTKGQITFYNLTDDKYKFTHIFCMAVVCENDLEDGGKLFNEKIKQFGDSILLIYDLKQFFDKLFSKLDNYINDNIIINYSAGKINYIDFKKHNGKLDAFCKHDEYNYQKEWRLGIQIKDNCDKPFELYMGSLQDFSKIVEIENFKNKIEFKNGKPVILIN